MSTVNEFFASGGAGATPIDPIAAFSEWLAEAHDAEALAEAVCVATLSPEGQPRSRMVLLKGVRARGFEFYTNYESRKGHDIAQHQRVGMTFHWKSLERQVQIEGAAERLDAEESDAYWATRPRGSQLGGWMSDQSRPVDSRAALEAKRSEIEARFEGSEVPRPPHWGGYLVVPTRFEFWQGRADRLHDRLVYARAGEGAAWTPRRLQP